MAYIGNQRVLNITSKNVVAQAKTVTPTKSPQDVFPDTGYTHLSKVTVNPIPSDYIVPSGSLEITEDGIYDVTGIARVVINVGGNLKNITVYMANNDDPTIRYALEGVKEGMTWREWIDATGGKVGTSDGAVWIENDNLYCGSYADIHNSNGEQQMPDSVIVAYEIYRSSEVFEGM